MKVAMKDKDKDRLSTLRLILAEFKRIEVDERIEVDDARALAVLDKMVKQRRDSIEQYENAGRADLAAKEAAEIAVIEVYLPQAASIVEVNAAVEAAVAETGASSMQDMGTLMKATMAKLAGKNADGKMVSEAVKARLS